LNNPDNLSGATEGSGTLNLLLGEGQSVIYRTKSPPLFRRSEWMRVGGVINNM